MRILAIDPGPTESAWVIYDSGKVVASNKHSNELVIGDLRGQRFANTRTRDLQLVVEMIASYGLPVGVEIFSTCVFIGRLLEAWGDDSTSSLMFRKDVKMHLCGQTAKVNDAVIRQALIDRFGPEKRKAIGTKMQPGPLYGVKGDVWAALAVAVTYADKHAERSAA